MTFTPTAEQRACIAAARESKDNLLIEALAGAAKTTTLELIGKALTSTPILYIVFNKRNAEEAAKRLPGHIQSKTLNALGHRVWLSALGRTRVVLDAGKMHSIVKALGQDLPKAARQEFFDSMADTMRLVRTARIMGYIPPTKGGRPLSSLEAVCDSLEFDPTPLQLSILDEALTISIDMAFEGKLDFDDQIYMPTLFGGTWPAFPLTMVDEAQDLSPLNHEMLRLLVGNRRLIAVGDPYQSIYGFRGAVCNGMEVLASTFSMTRLPLSTSFRCPRAVIRKAQARVPHMQWPEWAAEGEVRTLGAWDDSSIPDDAAIICRNNAPLFKLGLELIKHRRGIRLLGADIGPGLIRLLKKLGPESMERGALLAAISNWEEAELRRSKKKASISDRAACLRVFAGEAPTLSGAIAFAEHLFKAEGPIQLMSGHKAKGLEFDTVFHLDPWRIPSTYAATPEDIAQELNLGYVILTRAKRLYVEISMNNYGEFADDPA